MRKTPNLTVEPYRLRNGPMASSRWDGNNGSFLFRMRDEKGIPTNTFLVAIASDGLGWEHVSVSVKDQQRVPTWEEMCYVKDLFWSEEEEVIQYHPRRSEYVNYHAHTLHLWRPIGVDLPRPDPLMIGPPPDKRR